MRKSAKTFIAASAFVAGLVTASALYAHESQGPRGPATGMMGGMKDMMNMMNMMMGGSGRMAEHCGRMMQGSGRPNEQWRKDAPAQPKM